MTDNEIIKGYCKKKLCPPAQEIINRQKTEIERLKDFRKDVFFNLLGNCLVYSKNLKDYNDMRKGLKSEALKEFAERLKEKYKKDFNSTWRSVYNPIDNLIKEMAGKTHETNQEM